MTTQERNIIAVKNIKKVVNELDNMSSEDKKLFIEFLKNFDFSGISNKSKPVVFAHPTTENTD